MLKTKRHVQVVMIREIDTLLKAIITLINNSSSLIRPNNHAIRIKLTSPTINSSNNISKSQLTIIWQHLTKLVVSSQKGSHLSIRQMLTKLLLSLQQTWCLLHLHLFKHSFQVLLRRHHHSSQRLQQTHPHLIQANPLLQCQMSHRLPQVLMRPAWHLQHSIQPNESLDTDLWFHIQANSHALFPS